MVIEIIIICIILITIALLFYKDKNSNETKIDKISFKEAFDLTNLPIITLVIDNTKMNFVLDTGSTSTVIDKGSVENNNIKYDIIRSTNLIGIDGNYNPVTVGSFTARYKDREYKFNASIKDMSEAFKALKNSTGVNASGLLGSDFFETYKYVIDFKNLIAYSNR